MQTLKLVLVGLIVTVQAAADRDGLLKAGHFLKQFGYLDALDENLAENDLLEKIRNPLKEFKQFFDLGDDDSLDSATLEKMSEPRCAIQDKYNSKHQDHNISKRYAFLGSPDNIWCQSDQTCPVIIGFKSYTKKLSKSVQRTVLWECAKLWASQAAVSFRMARSGERPWVAVDYVYMDGPYGTVGQGYSPTPFLDRPNSYLHLDRDEPWTARSSSLRDGDRYVSLQTVMCHELGHTLGLGHSRVRNALMYPQTDQPGKAHLTWDDIEGIQALYGAP